MDVKFGEYASQLYNRGFSPMFNRDLPGLVEGLAEAVYLYPIEAIASSIILGLIGSIFGGMIVAPLSYLIASVLTMSGFCKETKVFMDRFSQEWEESTQAIEGVQPSEENPRGRDPRTGLEVRESKVRVLKDFQFQDRYQPQLANARRDGMEMERRNPGQEFDTLETVRTVERMRAARAFQGAWRARAQAQQRNQLLDLLEVEIQ